MKIKLLFIFIFLLSQGATYAQKKKSKSKSSSTTVRTTVAPKVSIDELLTEYRFEEALDEIASQVEVAEKKKQPTDELYAAAEKARIGANMLSATAKVVFIDSFEVNTSNILSIIKTDASCGTLDYWRNIFEPNSAVSKNVTITTTYTNDFKDKLMYCYPDSTGHAKLFCRYMVDGKWSNPESLDLGDETSDEAYPYPLSDGITLYYGSTQGEGLGGYDIYVTRYNSATKRYLKAENLGMPYNSPANDYMMVIDEVYNLGWLVTDRNQPEGKVCIYLFVPDETRNIYNQDEVGSNRIRSLAMLKNISESQMGNKTIVAEARQRYAHLLEALKKESKYSDNFYMPVYNGIVYTSLDQFKSSRARQLATNWHELTLKRTALLTELNKNRRKISETPSLRTTIIRQEQTLGELDDTIKNLEWNIRYEEQEKLGIKN